MLYSESGNRWAFVFDKGSFPQNSFREVVNGIYSIASTRQVIKIAKQEVKFQNLIQELVEPTCEIKQDYLEEDLVHDDTYYLEMAAFEFQDTDFLVPTNQFVQKVDPEHFSAIFGPDFGATETLYQFPGVAASEFRGLMQYLYPLNVHNLADELTIENWIAILKLSTKWRMLALREEAIQKLSSNNDSLSAIMKVQLGKECKVTEWVRSGYVALVEREEHFTEADVIAIGLESVTKLCEVREQRYAGEWDTYCNRLTLEAHGTSNLIADRISRFSSVDHLDYDDDDLVVAVLDAQSLGNRRLILDAWGRMARRLESLTLDEVERLTLGTALMMWEVRFEMRRASWSLVQEYGAKCDIKPLETLKRIASAFASEIEDIKVQALGYALFRVRSDLDKGKKPEVYAHGDTEEEEEIPDSALEPLPEGSPTALFQKSLELRKRIQDLEQKLDDDTDITLSGELRKDLRRYRLSAERWCTLVVGFDTAASTLVLNTGHLQTLSRTLKEMMTRLILKNASNLSLDGSNIPATTWSVMKSIIYSLTGRYHIKTRIVKNSRVIHIILPVSEF